MSAIEVVQTEAFADWLHSLRDRRAAARIAMRLRRAEHGNLGDVRPVGDGVSEMRIDYGPGYRVYFIARAKALAKHGCPVKPARPVTRADVDAPNKSGHDESFLVSKSYVIARLVRAIHVRPLLERWTTKFHCQRAYASLSVFVGCAAMLNCLTGHPPLAKEV